MGGKSQNSLNFSFFIVNIFLICFLFYDSKLNNFGVDKTKHHHVP